MSENFLDFYMGQKAIENGSDLDKVQQKDIKNDEINAKSVRKPIVQKKEPVKRKIQISDIPMEKSKEVFDVPIGVKETKKQIENVKKETPIKRPTSVPKTEIGKIVNGQELKPVTGEELELLFKMSETSLNMREEWISLYNSSFKTQKRGYVVEKCKKGLFRLTDDNKVEILSEYSTYGRNTKDILSDLTKPDRTLFNKRVE